MTVAREPQPTHSLPTACSQPARGGSTEVGHPREGTRQTVREGLNVVRVKEPSSPNR